MNPLGRENATPCSGYVSDFVDPLADETTSGSAVCSPLALASGGASTSSEHADRVTDETNNNRSAIVLVAVSRIQ